MQVFDRVNDSRFWKSFITVYNSNKGSAAPKWDVAQAEYFPDGAVADQGRFKGGEPGIKYIVNEPGDKRFTDLDGKRNQLNVLKDGKLCNTHTFIRYYANESFNWNVKVWLSLSGVTVLVTVTTLSSVAVMLSPLVLLRMC